MANFNKVILAGNLTRDPQLSYTPSNTPVVEFGLAINRKWRTPDGQMRDEVCFVDCRAFGRQAETLNQYMKKGRPILIEGRLRFEQWEGKDGQKRSRLSVVVDTFQFLGGPREGAGYGGQPAAAPAYGAPAAGAYAAPPAGAAPVAAPAEPMEYHAEAPPPEDFGPPPSGPDIPF